MNTNQKQTIKTKAGGLTAVSLSILMISVAAGSQQFYHIITITVGAILFLLGIVLLLPGE